MGAKELLQEALKLDPGVRLRLVDGLISSLDEPDRAVDELWAEEAERRLEAYRQGRLGGHPQGGGLQGGLTWALPPPWP